MSSDVLIDKNEIRRRAASLLLVRGVGIAERGDIILILMQEFGISDQSACQYLAVQRRRLCRLRPKTKRGGRAF